MELLAQEIQELVNQLELEETIKNEEDRNDGELKKRRYIRGLISRTETFSQFMDLENKEWPKECFERVTIKTGTFPMDQGDIILLRDEKDATMDFGAARRLKESFPELINFREKGWETLILNSRRITETAENKSWEKQIHAGWKGNDEELFNQLISLKGCMIEQKRDKGVLPVDRGYLNPKKIAKMIECVFKKTDIKIDLYCWEGDVKEESSRKGFRTNALLIKRKV